MIDKEFNEKLEACINDIMELMADDSIKYGEDSHWKLCEMIECIDAICRNKGYTRKWTHKGYRVMRRR